MQPKITWISIKHRTYLKIDEWSANEIEADDAALGLSGSPTKVKKIENVVFKAKESKVLSNSDTEIDELDERTY